MGEKGTHVPKFGNWDSNDHMPFTKVFDNARANKGGKIMNPNDPMENPSAFGLDPDDVLGNRTKPPASSNAPQGVRREQEAPVRKQVAELRPFSSQSDATHERSRSANISSPSDPLSRRVHDLGRGSSATGSADNSPRISDRARSRPSTVSPGLDKKLSSDFSSGAPQRARQQSVSSSADKSPALPKFGDWNPNDPSAGQGFTMIFDNARNEKKTGGVMPAPSLQAAESTSEPNSVRTRVDPPKATKTWFCCLGSTQEP